MVKKLFLFLLLGMFMISFASSALTDGLVSYYKLDETSGATAYDSLGLYNLSNSNAIVNQIGKINTSYDFDGTTSRLNNAYEIPYSNFTINSWVNLDTSGVIRTIYSQRKLSDGNPLMQFRTQYGMLGVEMRSNTGTGYINNYATTKNLTGQGWALATLTYDVSTGSAKVYVNGTSVLNTTYTGGTWSNVDSISIGAGTFGGGENYWDGKLDEVGIWNRALTPTEITELYNSGAGLSYPFAGGVPTVTLESPINGTTISDVGTNFTVSGNNISTIGNWTNVTFNLYTSNGTLHNSTTVDFTDAVTFNETLFIDEFVLGTYYWNATAWYTNSTSSYSVDSSETRQFSVIPFATLQTTYDADTIEGSSEFFSTNLSVISFERMSTVQFIYDGTSYAVAPVEYATNEYYLANTINVPQVSANENKSFYWSVRLESGLVYNTTSINQTVYNVGIDNCSSYTNQIFNFTMRDETTQTILVGATDNTSIKVSMVLTNSLGEIVNFSKLYDKVNPARVCLNYPMTNSSVTMDAVIEYTRSSGFVEFYNIQDYTLNATTQSQNISLYNLKTAEGQEFKLTYKGLDFVPVSDLIIQIQRKYIDEGVFKTIEIPMSGSNGFTIAHLVPNDVVYNLIFMKNGELLDTFTDVIATCQNPTFTDCEINLNALVSGTDLFGLVEESDFFSSLSYTPSTRTISSTYGIISGVSGTTQLQVYLLDNFGTELVCNDSLIAAGGTLSCVVPESFGNATVQAKVLLNGEIRREGFISMDQKPKVLYAGVLVFMSIIMLLFLLGIGVQENPMIMGIFLIFGLIVLVGLNLVYSTSWIGVGATILWFVIAVVMILIKGGSKR